MVLRQRIRAYDGDPLENMTPRVRPFNVTQVYLKQQLTDRSVTYDFLSNHGPGVSLTVSQMKIRKIFPCRAI